MSRGYQKNMWKKLAAAVLFLVTILVSVFAVYEFQAWTTCEEQRRVLEGQLQSYQKTVYVATERLPKGTVLTEDKLRKEVRYSEFLSEYLISVEDIGKSMLVDVEEGTWLTKNMLYEGEKNVREVFIKEIEVAEHLQTGDRVDIRLRYPNAEDYIVLLDKILVKYDSDSGIVLELTEEELLLLSSAISDCSLYEKTKLYAVEYPKYPQISMGVVTYIANKEILRMLGKEILEGERRVALELRLGQTMQ